MALKRSRSATEARFLNAVLKLVAETGFAHLGINVIAERTGSDKVLIYRYFGSLDGLLQRVAESQSWLPSADELSSKLPDDPQRLLEELTRRVCRHLRMNRTAHQISLWRHAVKNPLTEQYASEWKSLWQEIPKRLGSELSYEARKNWQRACALLALSIEAELAGEAIDSKALDLLCHQLVTPYSVAMDQDEVDDPDILPTNLL